MADLMKRIKNDEQAADALDAIAAATLKIEAAEVARDRAIADAKTAFKESVNAPKAATELLAERIYEYVLAEVDNGDLAEDPGKRSRDIGSGTVGIREGKPSLKLKSKVKAGHVARKLFENDLAHLVRVDVRLSDVKDDAVEAALADLPKSPLDKPGIIKLPKTTIALIGAKIDRPGFTAFYSLIANDATE